MLLSKGSGRVRAAKSEPILRRVNGNTESQRSGPDAVNV